MTKEMQEVEKKKELYRGIAILATVGYFLTLFIQSKTETGKNIVTLMGDLLSYTLIISSAFWIRRQIMIISIFLYFIYFNLKLLKNPVLIRVDFFYTYNFYLVGTGFLILAGILFFASIWTNIPLKFVRKEFDLKENYILVPLIVVTLLIQVIPRLFHI